VLLALKGLKESKRGGGVNSSNSRGRGAGFYKMRQERQGKGNWVSCYR